MSGKARFEIYRYQILPIEQSIQFSLDEEIPANIDELKAKKNELFHEAIISIPTFEWSRAELIHQILIDNNSEILLRIGAARGLQRTTREFEKETVEDWPNALVYIDNRPDHQIIAIQVEYKAFRKSRTLAKILEDNINNYLRKYLLHVTILPVFDQYEFWQLVDKYPRQITQARFDMVTPNMSNISKNLKLDLTMLGRETNTQETMLELNSDKNSYLVLSRNNKFLQSLVYYISEGGGIAMLKVRSMRRRLSTRDSVKEINIGELKLTSLDETQAKQLINKIQETIDD